MYPGSVCTCVAVCGPLGPLCSLIWVRPPCVWPWAASWTWLVPPCPDWAVSWLSCHMPAGFCVLCLPEEGIGEVLEKEDCMQALSGQIFMGMVSSQYQARLDIVRLIDGLVNACIRFVYFSLEDELRSKVGRASLFAGPPHLCEVFRSLTSAFTGVCREDGPGDRLELPHLPHAQR